MKSSPSRDANVRAGSVHLVNSLPVYRIPHKFTLRRELCMDDIVNINIGGLAEAAFHLVYCGRDSAKDMANVWTSHDYLFKLWTHGKLNM